MKAWLKHGLGALGLALAGSVAGCAAQGADAADGTAPPTREGVEAGVPDSPAPSPTPTPTPKDPLSTGLPPEELPRSGTGEFVFAPGSTEVVGNSRRVKTYAVGVEEGLDIDPAALAAFVDGVYADERSWIGQGRFGFQRVQEDPFIRWVIATPQTVDRLCRPLNTEGQVSCARNGYIAVNLLRWELAVEHWDQSLTEYRTYVVNHEMGHYLGKPHVGCDEPGGPAPVMMQQTYRLEQCTGNGWVDPGEAPASAAPTPATADPTPAGAATPTPAAAPAPG